MDEGCPPYTGELDGYLRVDRIRAAYEHCAQTGVVPPPTGFVDPKKTHKRILEVARQTRGMTHKRTVEEFAYRNVNRNVKEGIEIAAKRGEDPMPICRRLAEGTVRRTVNLCVALGTKIKPSPWTNKN